MFAVWSALAADPDLPLTAQLAVAEVVAEQGTRAQRVGFYGRTDLVEAARVRFLERLPDPVEAAAFLHRHAGTTVGQVEAVWRVHGAMAGVVLACAGRPGLYPVAARIAAQLPWREAVRVAYRWPALRCLLPEAVHRALVDAMLADLPPRKSPLRGDGEPEVTLQQLLAEETGWEGALWDLLEDAPHLWEELARAPGPPGRHIQWLLLARAGELSDDVLRACLPAVTHAWLRGDRRWASLHTRLCCLAEAVRKFPRLRDIAHEWIDQAVADVTVDGWTPKAKRVDDFGWKQMTAVAVLGTDPGLLAATARAVAEATRWGEAFQDRETDAEIQSWEELRTGTATALVRNPSTPPASVVLVVPFVDETVLCLAAGRSDPAVRRACTAELQRRHPTQQLSRRAGRSGGVGRVPSDRTLARRDDPRAALASYLGLLDGPPAQRMAACAAFLASRYTDDAILCALPAARVLAAPQYADRVADLVRVACGDEPLRWAAWRHAGDAVGDLRMTFGQLLDRVATAGMPGTA